MAIDADDDRTADRAPPHPRSRIADVILADTPAHLDADAVEAVRDASWSATEAAIRNSYPLVDFENPYADDYDPSRDEFVARGTL